ncbi:MAG: hypothetical protein QG622_2929 [Actinomycetota bacterium]|nr:hypothetical protein [Actinomycetota bacterium]
MLVVHALWAVCGLVIWAEDAQKAAGAIEAPRRGGRPPRTRPHPFAVTVEELRRVVPGLGAVDPSDTGSTDTGSTEATLLLPTVRGVPLPSAELPVDIPSPTGIPTSARWQVPAVRVATRHAAALLGTEPAGDVITGTDWRHLRRLADFVDDLVARGRVLPTVVPMGATGPTGPTGPTGAAARWRPLLTGGDGDRARALALATPPAMAAATDDDGVCVPPRDVVVAALDDLTDAAARERLTNTVSPGAASPGTRSRGTASPRTQSRRTASQGAASRGAAATAMEWRRALLREDAYFEARADEVTRLASDLAVWQQDALGRAVRARFRLVEPPEPPEVSETDEPWRLEFALQATREPSVVVDARTVWSADPDGDVLRRYVEEPHEALLSELGRARRLMPELGAALRSARPTALELDSEGAHRFLREGASILSAAGFAVEVPGWWGRPAAKPGVRLTAGTPSQPGLVAGTSALGRAAVVDYRWEVALGDHVLTHEELTALARLQQPLVRLRGQWVEVDAAGLRRALSALEQRGEGRMSIAELFGTLVDEQAGPGGLPVVGVNADGWLGDLLAGAPDQRLEPVPTPERFTGVLRPYQQRGLAWLAFLDDLGLGAVLADDMGLGKTVQLLALVARDLPQGPGTTKGSGTSKGSGTTEGSKAPATLLVCPMSLVGNWQREAARFVPGLRVHVHHGGDRAKGEVFAAAVAASDLVITTYAVAARDTEELAAVTWRRIVLDEAQAVKNAATKQALAVRALPAEHRIAVTGTPVENRLADLWSIMDFVNPGLLGGASGFKRRFAVPIERDGDDDAAARLRTLTQPFVLRRVKTDRSIISDLPEKLEMEVLCSLTTEQAALYQAVVDDMLDRIDASEGIERRGLVLATMTKLKQVCNHPAQVLKDGSRLAGRSGKLARVEETVEEILAAGERTLLFTQFAEFGGMVRAHLTARFGREVLFLHGGVPKAERDDMVARFSAPDDGAPPLFVLSLKAGGTGLNLTAANHVIHVDRWWNPAVEDQATDRVFRIGQTRSVQVRKLVCAGTLEERISSMISEKRGLAARIVGTGEGWLTGLRTEQLRDLLRLETSAVTD